MMKVAILALQGAFAEHQAAFRDLGVETLQIRQLTDLARPFDALVLPGGESTVQGKLLYELGLFAPIRSLIREGLPVMATCAGLILLAERLADDPKVWFGTLHASVRRNAYGRQLGSFCTQGNCGELTDIPMTFIRAPYIEECAPDVTILSRYADKITAVRQGNQLAMSFHPELLPDRRLHEYFLQQMVATAQKIAV